MTARDGQALVGIIMGSDSDWETMEPAAKRLRAFEIPCDVQVMSAHRSPAVVAEYASSARKRGLAVIIAGAGGAAHLAGVVAAHTTLPVIGVPVGVSLGGLDALLATVQMPSGIPVATVAIGNGENAALLAIEILALSDDALAGRLAAYRADLTKMVLDDPSNLKPAVTMES